MASNDTPGGLKPRTHRGAKAANAPATRRDADAAARLAAIATQDGEEADASGPVSERKCILTGTHDARDALIRLAISPDGEVLPDVRAKAPGRGAWIGVDRATLEQAQAKGKLRGALARAFKGKPLVIPDDLGARIEAALERAFLDRLGLESRSGTMLLGSDRIEEAARKGRVALLFHAADAGEDGCRKLDQALRVGSDQEGSGARGLVIPATRTILAMALGRENVVHGALVDRAAAGRVSHALARWRGFIERNGEAEPRDTSRGRPASTGVLGRPAPDGMNDAGGAAAGNDAGDLSSR